MKNLKKPDQIKETDVKRIVRDLIVYIVVNILALVGGKTLTNEDLAGLLLCVIISACLLVYLLLNRKHKKLVEQLWSYIVSISQTNIDVQQKLNTDNKDSMKELEEHFLDMVSGMKDQLDIVNLELIKVKEKERTEIDRIMTKKYRKYRDE